METLAQRLTLARKQRGLTQTALAEMSGLKQPDISKIEVGAIAQTTGIARLARALRVPAEWLEQGVGSEPDWNARPAALVLIAAEENADDAGRPRQRRPTRVRGTARLGEDGFYEQLDEPDGFVDSDSSDPDAYALRVKGDSMHPAIRHGWFVVVEPNGRCVVGEYVALQLRCGRKMVKELVIERTDEVVVESVNGNQRRTIDRADIESMCPVGAIVLPSKWRTT